jgi:RNA polymerase sigma factor (sigma-70 family)
MPGEQPYLSEPGADEKSILEEMMRDQDSKHWEKCHEFVMVRVYAKTKDIPKYDQEDIIQEIMYKVTKYLPAFRFGCTFRTWLYQIIAHCISDKYRKDKHRNLRNEERLYFPSVGPLDEKDREGEELRAIEEKSAEEAFEISDEIRNGMIALLEYARTHSNPVRNRLIIQMVIFEGYTQVATAKTIGCDAGVVGYVIREAQRYAREKMGHKL